MFVGLIGWVVVGLIVGFIVMKIINLRGDDPRLGLGVSGIGAVIGGGLYSMLSGSGVSAWNPWSLLFAAVGSVAAAGIWHLVRSRFVSHDSQTTRRSY